MWRKKSQVRCCSLKHPKAPVLPSCRNDVPFLSLPEYPAATFGLEDSSSFASFTLADNPMANFSVSFFIRTLKPEGLVLQVHDGTGPCLTVYLKDGRLLLETPSAGPMAFSEVLADGKRHLVTLSFREGVAYISHSDREVELGHLGVRPLAVGHEVYVGGLPQQESMGTWGGYFKGCLQDIQLNNHRLELFAHQADNYSLPRVAYVGRTTGLVQGCISDDTCKVGMLCSLCTGARGLITSKCAGLQSYGCDVWEKVTV